MNIPSVVYLLVDHVLTDGYRNGMAGCMNCSYAYPGVVSLLQVDAKSVSIRKRGGWIAKTVMWVTLVTSGMHSVS